MQMLVIFKGDPNEHAKGEGLSRTSITLDGVYFPMGQAVDASALPARAKDKMRRNPHFEVLGDAPAFALAPSVLDDADEQAEIEALKARSTKRARKE